MLSNLGLMDILPGPQGLPSLEPIQMPSRSIEISTFLIDGPDLLATYHYEMICGADQILPFSQTIYLEGPQQEWPNSHIIHGLEVSGWEVHVIDQWGVEVASRTRGVFSNPTVQQSDGDGLNDYQEFTNSSDPYGTSGLDTDGDHIPDQYESTGELTIIDGKAPDILKFSDGSQVHLNIKFSWDGILSGNALTMDATVKVSDNAGVDSVTIWIHGVDKKTTYLTNAPRSAEVTINFKLDGWRALTSGFDINITVNDVNGNGNNSTTHVDGVAEGLAKLLIKAWNNLVDKVKKLASAALDWLWGFVKNAFDRVLKPIIDIISDFINRINTIVKEFYNLISDLLNNSISGTTLILKFSGIIKDFIELLMGNPLLIMIMTMFLVIRVTEFAVAVYSMGIGSIIMMSMKDMIKNLILSLVIIAIQKSGLIPKFEGSMTDIFRNMFGVKNTGRNIGEATIWSLIFGGLSLALIIYIIYIKAKCQTMPNVLDLFGALFGIIGLILGGNGCDENAFGTALVGWIFSLIGIGLGYMSDQVLKLQIKEAVDEGLIKEIPQPSGEPVLMALADSAGADMLVELSNLGPATDIITAISFGLNTGILIGIGINQFI